MTGPDWPRIAAWFRAARRDSVIAENTTELERESRAAQLRRRSEGIHLTVGCIRILADHDWPDILVY